MRRVVKIERMRREFDGPTLLFDAGDHLRGSSFCSFLHGEAELATLALLGHAATAVRNHDYDEKGVLNFHDLGCCSRCWRG
eukprot:m.222829 g.222829  ORF g.222829 m.222829 type:complete len:81 (+) comp15632_c0_seq2:201-443(+)